MHEEGGPARASAVRVEVEEAMARIVKEGRRRNRRDWRNARRERRAGGHGVGGRESEARPGNFNRVGSRHKTEHG